MVRIELEIILQREALSCVEFGSGDLGVSVLLLLLLLLLSMMLVLMVLWRFDLKCGLCKPLELLSVEGASLLIHVL